MTPLLTFDPNRRTSAQAIADLATLGHLTPEQRILDVTYGEGNFWTIWKPLVLWANDLYTDCAYSYDYRHLPAQWRAFFDVTVFDPPFKLKGTGGSHPSDERFGVATPYRSLDALREEFETGFSACVRVTKPGGLIIYKTQDQVSGGHRQYLTKEMPTYAWVRHGVKLIEEIFIHGWRKQPKRKCKACDGSGRRTLDPEYESRFDPNCSVCEGEGKVEVPQVHALSSASAVQVYRKPK